MWGHRYSLPRGGRTPKGIIRPGAGDHRQALPKNGALGFPLRFLTRFPFLPQTPLVPTVSPRFPKGIPSAPARAFRSSGIRTRRRTLRRAARAPQTRGFCANLRSPGARPLWAGRGARGGPRWAGRSRAGIEPRRWRAGPAEGRPGGGNLLSRAALK